MTTGAPTLPSPAPPRPGALPDRWGLAAAVLTAVLAFGVLLLGASAAQAPAGDVIPYAPAFRGAQDGPAVMMNRHDGQAFGSLALDPLLAHPERWSDGAPALAYRASRPLLGWLVMLTSLGRASGPPSLLAWTA